MNAKQQATTEPVEQTTEHELKFELGASMAAEFDARSDAGLSREPRRVWSCYYDTSAGDLMNAGIALRVRSVEGGFVQTLKAARADAGASGNGSSGEHAGKLADKLAGKHAGKQADEQAGTRRDGQQTADASSRGTGATTGASGADADPFTRFEWERPIGTPTPSADALPPPSHPAGALARECLSMLLPVFETDFERRTRMVLPLGIGRVELACDRGEIRAGQSHEPIAEVELERKEGSAALFYRYALQWARLHDARLLLPSKHERGLRLAGWRNGKPQALKQAPAAPQGATPVARAARMVLGGHLRHFLANLPAVQETDRPEGPHQMRVALRRLRASIRFFGLREDPLSDEDSPWRSIDRMARAIANAASFVRDADVFESRLLGELERSFPRDAALQVLARSLVDERERSRARLRATLSAASTTEFILLTLAAIEAIEPARFDAADYRSFAASRIAGLVRKVRRRAASANGESDWHETRIAIKNLRYAMDGCTALELTREPAGRVLARLADWQDTLGEGQDLAVARSTASQALGGASAPIEMSVRCIALIDGYRTFVMIHADQHRLVGRIRSQLKSMFDVEQPARSTSEASRSAVGAAPAAQTAPEPATKARLEGGEKPATKARSAPKKKPTARTKPKARPSSKATANRKATSYEKAGVRTRSVATATPMAPAATDARALEEAAKPRRGSPALIEATPLSKRARPTRAPGASSASAGLNKRSSGNVRPGPRSSAGAGARRARTRQVELPAGAIEPEPVSSPPNGDALTASTAAVIASMAANLAAEVEAALGEADAPPAVRAPVPDSGIGQSGTGADAFGDNKANLGRKSRARRDASPSG